MYKALAQTPYLLNLRKPKKEKKKKVLNRQSFYINTVGSIGF